jgi:hypothetical protein
MPSLDEIKSSLRDATDDYEQTVIALLALSQHLKYEHSANSWFGRKFKTSEKNRVSPNTDITPDLTTQINKNYGIITEARKNFARAEDYDDKITQIKKYDDELKGWETQDGLIQNNDLVILTHLLEVRGIEDHLKERLSEFTGKRKIIILGFIRDNEKDVSVVIRREGSETFSEGVGEKLRRGVAIKYEHLLNFGLSTIKFYDANPPLPYLLEIIWDNILSEKPTEEEYRTNGKKKIEIITNVDEIVTELKRFAPEQNGDRLPEIPKRSWVETALEKLVEIKLAKKIRKEDRHGTYKISFRRKLGKGENSLEIFIDLIAKTMQQTRL